MNQDLRILQINLNRSVVANDLLKHDVERNSIDIVLFQDGNLGKAGSINSWPTLLSGSKNCGILISNSNFIFNCTKINKKSIFINLITDLGNLTIGTVYSPPSSDFGSDMREWTPQFPSSNLFLIGGDFNAHSPPMGVWPG